MLATVRQDAAPHDLVGTASFEYLHLHMRRTHWETKTHPDLGSHLQDALDKLAEEGWHVVAAYAIDRTPEVILWRITPPPVASPTPSPEKGEGGDTPEGAEGI